MDGLLRCSRYSFGPNRLHYCGPDANREMLAYLENNASDPGLEKLLRQFQTLFPYLRLIAQANRIKNPFDARVVEAYWIGNNLLQTVAAKQLYAHWLDVQQLKKRLKTKLFNQLAEKLRQKPVPHHSFHVFNVWKRTGHWNQEHTLETLDSCRVSWGIIERLDGPIVKVRCAPLIQRQGKFLLAEPVSKRVVRALEANLELEELKIGDSVSVHWGVICELLSAIQVKQLRYYTLQSIALANQTL